MYVSCNPLQLFLRTAALNNGTMLNFAKISSDIGVPASTVREYYQILEDTLVGYLLPAWNKTKKRKAISSAKFYFFDIGVCNAITGLKYLNKESDQYGKAFEHFIAMELRAYIAYTRNKVPLAYWQSVYQHEVDFILNDKIALEVKSTSNVSNKHLKGLRVLQEENICDKYFLICFDNNRIDSDVEIIHWQTFLARLWNHEIIA